MGRSTCGKGWAPLDGRVYAVALLAAVGVFGCRTRWTSEDTQRTAGEARPLPAHVYSPPGAAPGSEISTEEDFELEASEEFTSKNLEQELDRLEKELRGQ